MPEAEPLFYSITQHLNKNTAHFKESEENKSSLMAQTNIVYTQGNLGIKRRRGNWQLQRSQEGPASGASAAFTGNHVSYKGRKGKPPVTVLHMTGGPSVRCLSWMYPQEEASLTTLTSNRLHWWGAHPRGSCSEQNVSTVTPRTSQIPCCLSPI